MGTLLNKLLVLLRLRKPEHIKRIGYQVNGVDFYWYEFDTKHPNHASFIGNMAFHLRELLEKYYEAGQSVVIDIRAHSSEPVFKPIVFVDPFSQFTKVDDGRRYIINYEETTSPHIHEYRTKSFSYHVDFIRSLYFTLVETFKTYPEIKSITLKFN